MVEHFPEEEGVVGWIPTPRTMNLDILYEHQGILVVNKPPGIAVHPSKEGETRRDGGRGGKGAGGKDAHTLVDLILAHAPEVRGIGEDSDRPGIVHRLDKDTSGVSVVAKNQETFQNLKELFKSRTIAKRYLAIVDGRVKEPRGTIELPIGRMGLKRTVPRLGGGQARLNPSERFVRADDAVGQARRMTLTKIREARTEYVVRKRFKDATLVELIPKTGRMHQLRVHLKAIDHPVLGDKLYGGKIAASRASRQMLHALSLEFSLGDKRFAFQADPPEDFEELLRRLQEELQTHSEETVEY